MRKEVIEKMQKITDIKVKHYKSDFELDKEYINNNDYNYYIWIARECGTHLLPIEKVLELESVPQIIYKCLYTSHLYIQKPCKGIFRRQNTTKNENKSNGRSLPIRRKNSEKPKTSRNFRYKLEPRKI